MVMENILGVMRKYETFLISSHINPDGDSIGSQLAIYSLLSDFGKKVSILNSNPVPYDYKFLLDFWRSHTVLKSEFGFGITSGDELLLDNVEVAIILDCGNISRIGKELAPKIKPKFALINIDHHLGNENFGTYNLVNHDACATGELVFQLMDYGNIKIDQYIANCLYTAILTDTGSFKFSNTTTETHKIAARLIDLGVKPNWIAEKVYEVVPYQRAKLFGKALETLRLENSGKIAYMWATREMFDQTVSDSEDTEGFVEYLRSLRGIEIAIFFRELEDSGVKVSLRSKGDFDVNKIAVKFGGGGHQAAAGCTISETLDKSIDMVLSAVMAEI